MNEQPQAPFPGQRLEAPGESTWRAAYRVFRAHTRSILLPAAVILGPLAIIFPAVLTYLYLEVWPEAELDTWTPETDAPAGFLFGSMLLVGVSGFITTIGLTAVIVAVRSATKGKNLPLVESLDPVFTRMGGLLIITGLLAVLGLLTTIGIFVMAYFIIRFGLAFHVFILEDAGAGPALRRCWTLLRGRMLRFMSMCLSIIGITFFAGTIIAFFAASIIQIVLLPFTDPDVSRNANVVIVAVMAGVTWLGMIPLFAFFATLTTTFYLKAREETPE